MGWPSLLLRGAIAGLGAGIGLGLLLKWLQIVTEERVYTLLLNIDFVPFMPRRLPETAEFALHLAVSLPLGILYVWMVESRLRQPMLTGVVLGLLAALTWIPLTLVSDRVPSTNDGRALLLWMLGHLCYGLLLSLFVRRGRLEAGRH
ncbi:hypothetical protein [Paenibacillus oenotherae]|nr:hypothetical protein [Paenibacillus oenotherae]